MSIHLYTINSIDALNMSSWSGWRKEDMSAGAVTAVRWQGVVSLSGALHNLFMSRHVTLLLELVNDTEVLVTVHHVTVARV